MRIALTILLWCVCGVPFLFADPRKPAPPFMDRATWFQKFSRQQKAIGSGRHRVCFLGDSLTAFWTAQGAAAWQLDFGKFSPANAGIAGDRVEQIHYRVKHFAFGRKPPEVFVVLAGTNNLSKQPPDDPGSVAEGVRAVVKTLRSKCPNAKILVLSVLPNGPEPEKPIRKSIKQVNAELKEQAGADGYEFLSVHDLFVDAEDRWKFGLTLDGTHLTEKGYDLLARPIAARLEALVGTSSPE